jgi:hypothetical protein
MSSGLYHCGTADSLSGRQLQTQRRILQGLFHSDVCLPLPVQLLVCVIAISVVILDRHIHARSSAGCCTVPDPSWSDMHITTNMRGGVNALRGSTSQPLHARSSVRILDVSPTQGLDARAAIMSRISGHMNARASPLSGADVRLLVDTNTNLVALLTRLL